MNLETDRVSRTPLHRLQHRLALFLGLLAATATGCSAWHVQLKPSPSFVVRLPSHVDLAQILSGLQQGGASPMRVHEQAGVVITRWASLGEAPFYRRNEMPDTFWPARTDAVARLVVAYAPGSVRLTPEVVFCSVGEWRTDGATVTGPCRPEGRSLAKESHRRMAAAVALAVGSQFGSDVEVVE